MGLAGVSGESLSRISGNEAARRGLARALHDDHGQRVTAIGFDLRAVRNRLAEDDPQRVSLDAVIERLGELGEDLRRLSHELHPATLERRGLAAALRDACAEIETRHGISIERDLPDAAAAIPPEVALAVYRIAQEGLVNVVRHARARTARLALRVRRGRVRLTLTDDGAGFDPDRARRAGGLGLVAMAERAELLGGRCHVVSTPGAGTRVAVSVPRHRFSRWLRRRWGWITAAALVFLTLVGGLVATALQARRAETEAHRAAAAVHFIEELFTAADPRRTNGEPPGARELLRRGRERLTRELADEPLLRARLLDTLGGIYTELGLYEEARPLLEEALALRQRLRGDAHPEVAATLVRLGSLAHLSGQDDAVALFRRALAIREARAGREPEALADALNKLGVTLAARGHLDQADAMLRRSLALYERLSGPADLRVAKVLHNLSGIAYYRRDAAEVEKLIGRTLAIREATLEEDDVDLAGSREVLALLRQQQGRLDEAAALLEKLAATAERVYGPEHPEYARRLLNLGKTRDELGENGHARALFERALAICEKTLGDEQPMRVRALAVLAGHHLRQGDHPAAEPLYRRLLALHERGVAYNDWDQVLAGWERLREENAPPGEPGGAKDASIGREPLRP